MVSTPSVGTGIVTYRRTLVKSILSIVCPGGCLAGQQIVRKRVPQEMVVERLQGLSDAMFDSHGLVMRNRQWPVVGLWS